MKCLNENQQGKTGIIMFARNPGRSSLLEIHTLEADFYSLFFIFQLFCFHI